MTPNAEVEYISAETGRLVAVLPFYDPGLDPNSAMVREEAKRRGREFPFLAYGCGGVLTDGKHFAPEPRKRYAVIPCERRHLVELARTMRAADRAEIEGAGRVPLLLLRSLWRRSVEPMAALVDGEVAAIWGDEAGLLAEEGHPWLFTSPAIEKLPLAFYREARREITAMLSRRASLVSQVDEGYLAALRFFKMLSFEIGDVCETPSGARYRMISVKKA
jgi:hypothetical protein